MKTSLLPDSLSSAYVDDTFTMKYATSACDMWLFLWFRLRHPLGQERLFVHWKALVHGCHVCFFNLAGIPVILSKSNISPIFKNSYVWRFYTCWSDCSWLPNCICSCCYRRFMANTSEMNKWSSVVEMTNPKAKRGQRTYTVTKLISRTPIHINDLIEHFFNVKHLIMTS